MENPIKMDDLGVLLFSETSIYTVTTRKFILTPASYPSDCRMTFLLNQIKAFAKVVSFYDVKIAELCSMMIQLVYVHVNLPCGV